MHAQELFTVENYAALHQYHYKYIAPGAVEKAGLKMALNLRKSKCKISDKLPKTKKANSKKTMVTFIGQEQDINCLR